MHVRGKKQSFSWPRLNRKETNWCCVDAKPQDLNHITLPDCTSTCSPAHQTPLILFETSWGLCSLHAPWTKTEWAYPKELGNYIFAPWNQKQVWQHYLMSNATAYKVCCFHGRRVEPIGFNMFAWSILKIFTIKINILNIFQKRSLRKMTDIFFFFFGRIEPLLSFKFFSLKN